MSRSVLFDTETTGVDVETDRIVSAAVVVQDAAGTRPRVTRWLVNPGVPVPAGATAVHGLTDEHLQRNGRWPSPVLEEIARELGEQAAAGRPLVVMNAPFDLTLLDRELRRHRASSLDRWFDPAVVGVHRVEQFAGRRVLGEHQRIQPGVLAVVVFVQEVQHPLQMSAERRALVRAR